MDDKLDPEGRRGLPNDLNKPSEPMQDSSGPPTLTRRLTKIASHLSGTANDPLAIRKRDFGFLPIPKNRRYDPSMKPEICFPWSLRINFLFAACATISVMNLYYIQPMLVEIATDFEVSHEESSRVAVLVQAGYGCGIALVSPLGDLVRRRQLVMTCMIMTTTLSIALALSKNVEMLQGVSFVVGLFTICIPWTADLAPSNIRARSMSITLSGLIFGLVLGRVLAGIISNFASWRYTYWMAVGLQGAMLGVAWVGLPDTPDKDVGLSYFQMLWSMAKFLSKYPTLVQYCLMCFLTSAVFAGFWTNLTYLLSSPPYHYNALEIGLFGLLGLIGALMAPQWGRLVDSIVPWGGQLFGVCLSLIAMIVALTGAEKSIGAVCVAIILYDMGQQCGQVSGSYRIAGIDPKARARLNACVILSIFVGQTSGTAIMTKIYADHGWTATGACAVAFVGTALLILLCRGPHETGWVGYSGGLRPLRRAKMQDLSPEAVTEGKRETTPEKELDTMGAVEQGLVAPRTDALPLNQSSSLDHR